MFMLEHFSSVRNLTANMLRENFHFEILVQRYFCEAAFAPWFVYKNYKKIDSPAYVYMCVYTYYTYYIYL